MLERLLRRGLLWLLGSTVRLPGWPRSDGSGLDTRTRTSLHKPDRPPGATYVWRPLHDDRSLSSATAASGQPVARHADPGYSKIMSTSTWELRFARGTCELLSPADAPAVLDLYTRCVDYFVLQDGEPPVETDAADLFTDVPSTKRPEQQHVLGYRRDGRLDAVAALLPDHPRAGDWYLGLLLLDPRLRGQGFGLDIYAGIEQWSKDRGARRMLVAVLETNVDAHRFWRSLDFQPVRTVAPARFKRMSHVRHELARRL